MVIFGFPILSAVEFCLLNGVGIYFKFIITFSLSHLIFFFPIPIMYWMNSWSDVFFDKCRLDL